MSWVQKRADRDKLVRDKAYETWRDLRAALKTAHDDFVANYRFGDGPIAATVKISCPEGRISISIEDRSQDSTPRIDIILDGFKVVVRETASELEGVFTMEATDDGAVALFHDGHALSPETACKMILEPFFFGGKTRPTLFPKK